MSNFALMLPFDPFAEVQEGIFEFSRNAARGIYFLKRHHPGFEQIDKERVEFGPDLIFISAGFDGHEDDLLGCCNLSEEDYVWATQQLMAIANRCCQGRVISVLEGGYNTRAEALSPFAAAVSAHVRTLMYTSQNYTFLDYEVELATIGEEQSQAEIAERFRFQRREEAKRLRRKRGWLFDDGLPPMKKAKEDDEEKVEGESEKVDKAEEKVPADEQVYPMEGSF
ncbi:hdaC [Symbiodinium pilosum]|uniref:HdaC protein n=1 Tax=Symbiodinium pilosum TaxID=2952 RepID=A0A812RRD1_SYMPI|nr:hdaC [Symbiodinium pilosum]